MVLYVGNLCINDSTNSIVYQQCGLCMGTWNSGFDYCFTCLYRMVRINLPYITSKNDLFFLEYISLFSCTACSDPGIVYTTISDESEQLEKAEKGDSIVPKVTNECGLCHVERPRNANHCFSCGVCVVELDHHCPVRLPNLNKVLFITDKFL